jgi:hypothetical protein
MILKIFTALLTSCFIGCAAQADKPEVTLNTFSDFEYPCAKVVFPDTITYNGLQRLKYDNETVLSYQIKINSMSGYDIRIVKRHSYDNIAMWALKPISEQFDESVKLYEIKEDEGIFGRSAAVALISKNGDIFLRSIIGEYTRPDTALLVITDRLVQKKKYAHLFSLSEWRESSGGKRFINDMIDKTVWFYSNTVVTECFATDGIGRFWWE